MKILYIASINRSGTTIIDQVLGQLEPFHSTGELGSIWERAAARAPCSCRAPIPECAFWSQVLPQVLEAEKTTFEEVAHLSRLHSRTLPRQVLQARPGAAASQRSDSLRWYAAIVLRLYETIAEVSGASVVIDSSKYPMGALIARMGAHEVCVLHVVRDPRAVAYSHSRAGSRAQQRPASAAWLSFRWGVRNALIETLLRRGHYRTLRYEDFARDPRQTVAEIADFVGLSGIPLPFDGPHSVRIGTHHISGGNTIRFKTGSVDIRLDDRWRREARAAANVTTSVCALPALWRYGYGFRSTVGSGT